MPFCQVNAEHSGARSAGKAHASIKICPVFSQILLPTALKKILLPTGARSVYYAWQFGAAPFYATVASLLCVRLCSQLVDRRDNTVPCMHAQHEPAASALSRIEKKAVLFPDPECSPARFRSGRTSCRRLAGPETTYIATCVGR